MSARPTVVVGVQLDDAHPRLYLTVHAGSHDGAVSGVRRLLEARLAELEAGAAAVRDVLATDQPERAERLLFDDGSVRVSEVAMRPVDGRAAVTAFVERSFKRTDSGR